MRCEIRYTHSRIRGMSDIKRNDKESEHKTSGLYVSIHTQISKAKHFLVLIDKAAVDIKSRLL